MNDLKRQIGKLTLQRRRVINLLRHNRRDNVRVLFFRLTRLFRTKPIPLHTNRVNRVRGFIGPNRTKFTHHITNGDTGRHFINRTPLNTNRGNNTRTIPRQNQTLFTTLNVLKMDTRSLTRLVLTSLLNKIIRRNYRHNTLLVLAMSLYRLSNRFFRVRNVLVTLVTRTTTRGLLYLFRIR